MKFGISIPQTTQVIEVNIENLRVFMIRDKRQGTEIPVNILRIWVMVGVTRLDLQEVPEAEIRNLMHPKHRMLGSSLTPIFSKKNSQD